MFDNWESPAGDYVQWSSRVPWWWDEDGDLPDEEEDDDDDAGASVFDA